MKERKGKEIVQHFYRGVVSRQDMYFLLSSINFCFLSFFKFLIEDQSVCWETFFHYNYLSGVIYILGSTSHNDVSNLLVLFRSTIFAPSKTLGGNSQNFFRQIYKIFVTFRFPWKFSLLCLLLLCFSIQVEHEHENLMKNFFTFS